MPRTSPQPPAFVVTSPDAPNAQVGVHLTVDAEMEQAIQACLECYNICLATSLYCVEEGGKYNNPTLMRLLLDCVDICQTTANFIRRISALYGAVCIVNEQVCLRCAEACDALPKDAQMHRCAEICRTCAALCRNLAVAMPLMPM